MLFNSYNFLFLFLPVTIFFFFITRKISDIKSVIYILIISSFVFYSVHNSQYLILFIFSIITNYIIGEKIIQNKNSLNKNYAKIILKIGITINLVLLFIFKYADFFISNISKLGFDIPKLNLLLPIGISFYTFQQIGYIVDCYKNKETSCKFSEYALFVSFFPQLIAGPIVHHSQFINQIKSNFYKPFTYENFSVGLIIFILGLFKKIIIADTISAKLVSPFYSSISQGEIQTIFGAWLGTVSYTLQIYYDFSAYSEMAIGLGLLFGIKLPINFNSPYKSNSLIEYWSRWNITLTNFIRDYIYQPFFARMSNITNNFFSNHIVSIIFSMSISGFWHGANWNYIIWGFIHGVALSFNHFLKIKRIKLKIPKFLQKFILILFINSTFVIFKCTNLSEIKRVFYSLMPLDKILDIGKWQLFNEYYKPNLIYILLIFLLIFIVFYAPTNLSIMGYQYKNNDLVIDEKKLNWIFNNKINVITFSILISTIFAFSVLYLHRQNSFIYFQF